MKTATALTADPFDLVEFAEAHRLKLRNIADGYPCPPVRRRRRRGHKPAFAGSADREDVIICRSATSPSLVVRRGRWGSASCATRPSN